MPFDRHDTLERNLERQNAWVRSTDAKIALLLPINTAMLGLLAAQLSQSHLRPAHVIVVVLASLPILASLAAALLAAMPRFRHESRSRLYFGDIAHRPREEYRDAMLNLAPDDHLADLAEQCHVTATLAQAKFRHVRNAYLAFFVALPFWMVAVYLLNRPG